MFNYSKRGDSIGLVIEQIIEKQIRQSDPPETALTYQRLVADSFTELEAKRLISMVVHVELFRLMRYGEAFNLKRYLDNLKGLPDLPDADI
ncbi:MAG: hypothetical protein CVT94_10435 [Bacteroidetes bacterium HGW-Bacteroidetes-11]|jgi:hypothetical protein|nr:MAG: hypothetical protein CVT94_10435 [Bacteroidetes bacterium HGW-Bacteroidetes-11]